jgi:hypothetical protein
VLCRVRNWLFARPPHWGAGEFVWLGAAVVAFVAQRIGVSRLGQDGAEADARRAIFYSTTAVLIVLALHFRRIAGAWLIAIGITMNFIPMTAHGGLMPVAWELIQESGEFPQITEADIGRQVHNSKDIVLRREDIHFEPLSDRYVLTLPWYGTNIYSLGDFVAFGGILLAAIQVIAYVVRGERPPRTEDETDSSEEATRQGV